MFISKFDRHSNIDPVFDLATAISEYLEENGIETDVTCDFDRNDPDYPTYDLCVYWEEDGDDRSFVYRNCQNLTPETLFDLWVRDREDQHEWHLAHNA